MAQCVLTQRSMAEHAYITVLHGIAQPCMSSLQAFLLVLQFSALTNCQMSMHYSPSGSCGACLVFVGRCEAAGANVKDGGDPKPSEFSLSETWQASSKLQQLCAEGLGRSRVKSRQPQGLLAGRLM